jgi:hypothetical protein
VSYNRRRVRALVVLPSLLCWLQAGCNDTAAVVQVVSDRAAGELDGICLELDADGASRFGRRYALSPSRALPQTLTALASGRASMQALVYGLRHGVAIARAREEVPFRPGTILQVQMALDACVAAANAGAIPTWMAAGQSIDPTDRAALTPAFSASDDFAIGAAMAHIAHYDASANSLGAPVPGPLGGGAVRQVLAADLDADCGTDLVVVADAAPPLLAIRGANGDYSAPAGALPTVLPTGATGVAAGDLDGDGNPDLVIVGGAEAHLMINDGAGRFHEAPGAFDVAPTDATAVALGDLDGDGHLDAVIGQGSATPALTRVYLNDAKGSGHFTLVAAALPPRAERDSALALGDVDGNGTLDLVVAHLAGPVRLFLNRGDALLEDRSFGSLPDQTSGDVPTLLLADLNADCALDLIVPRAGGAPLVWLNAGGARLTNAPPLPIGGVGTVAGVVADDVNGDGRVDLLVFGSGGLELLVQQ